MYEFTYHGDIVAYQRVRASFKGKKVRFYNNQRYTDFKQKIAGRAQQFVGEPFAAHVPVVLILEFGMGPKAKSSKIEYFTKAPDIDNLAKAIMDAFNKIVWHDDTCVVELAVTKHYSDSPYVKVQVGEWEE